MKDRNTKARIRREYRVQYPNPIRMKAGEPVHVGRVDDDDPGWLWSRAADGREGWMPVELLSEGRPLAAALLDYSARELAVQVGDEVEIEEVRHGWARVKNSRGEVGWIPQSHLDQ